MNSAMNIKSIEERYGPYGFGMVSLLVIWVAVVQPELRANKVNYEEIRGVVHTLQNSIQMMDNIAKTMDKTASTLDVVVKSIQER